MSRLISREGQGHACDPFCRMDLVRVLTWILFPLAGGVSGVKVQAPAGDSTRRAPQWSGDARFRGEWDPDRVNHPDRLRPRIRLRLSMEAAPQDHVSVGARVDSSSRRTRR